MRVRDDDIALSILRILSTWKCSGPDDLERFGLLAKLCGVSGLSESCSKNIISELLGKYRTYPDGLIGVVLPVVVVACARAGHRETALHFIRHSKLQLDVANSGGWTILGLITAELDAAPLGLDIARNLWAIALSGKGVVKAQVGLCAIRVLVRLGDFSFAKKVNTQCNLGYSLLPCVYDVDNYRAGSGVPARERLMWISENSDSVPVLSAVLNRLTEVDIVESRSVWRRIVELSDLNGGMEDNTFCCSEQVQALLRMGLREESEEKLSQVCKSLSSEFELDAPSVLFSVVRTLIAVGKWPLVQPYAHLNACFEVAIRSLLEYCCYEDAFSIVESATDLNRVRGLIVLLEGWDRFGDQRRRCLREIVNQPLS